MLGFFRTSLCCRVNYLDEMWASTILKMGGSEENQMFVPQKLFVTQKIFFSNGIACLRENSLFLQETLKLAEQVCPRALFH